MSWSPSRHLQTLGAPFEEADYTSWEDAQQALQAHARRNGYAVIRKDIKPSKAAAKRVVWQCEKSRKEELGCLSPIEWLVKVCKLEQLLTNRFLTVWVGTRSRRLQLLSF